MRLFAGDAECHSEGNALQCVASDDVEDAENVCRSLGIPHYTFDMHEQFKTDVMERFCCEMLAGRTPNPCIDCNVHMKFGALHQKRCELGIDYLATGHYAQRHFSEQRQCFQLFKAADAGKDQTYVLYNLTQEELAHTLFPLGSYQKSDVRRIAARHGFATASKRESQDICFIPDGDKNGFLERFTGHTPVPGDIIDKEGAVIGRHTGLERYTAGQRKGIGIAAAEPLYVIGKDMGHNQLIVGTAEQAVVRDVVAGSINLICGDTLDPQKPLAAKMNYTQIPQPCRAQALGQGRMKIAFDEPQRPSAPGQALVLYDGDRLIGGGTIL